MTCVFASSPGNRVAHQYAFRYLHIGFNAPEHLVERARVRLVWGILRVRHPLLACTVTMHSYEDVRFVCVRQVLGSVAVLYDL